MPKKPNISEKEAKNEVVSVRFSPETMRKLKIVAREKNIATSILIREYVDEGLKIKSYEENLDTFRILIREEIETSNKNFANRMAGLINRSNIAVGSIYYMLITILVELLPKDMYSHFEEIEKRAKKYGLEYANQKKDEAISKFIDRDLKEGFMNYIRTGRKED